MTRASEESGGRSLSSRTLRDKWLDVSLSTRRDIKFTLIAIGFTIFVFVGVSSVEQRLLKLNSQRYEGSEVLQAEEQCASFEPWLFKLYCSVTQSKLIGLVESFSIVLATWVFILRWRDRREQSHREAWSLIDGARESETSGARTSALKKLYEDKVSLEGLDADGADLVGINLKGANLSGASLKGARLQGAELEKTILRRADFRASELQGINLRYAELQGANLEEANLGERTPELWSNTDPSDFLHFSDLRNAQLCWTNFQGAILSNANLQNTDSRHAFFQEADLRHANFQEANLRHANFQGADLRHTNFQGANLQDAHFGAARNLTLEQLQQALNWDKARYDKSFCLTHSALKLLEDEPIARGVQNTRNDSLEIKLLETAHKLLVAGEVQKEREIAEIRKKIAELVKLLDSGSSIYLGASPVVEELSIAMENLVKGGDTSRDARLEPRTIKNKIFDLKESLRKGDQENKKYWENLTEAERLEKEAEELERRAEELDAKERLEEPS